MNIFKFKKIDSVLYVNVLMDINILRMMFENKLVKLLSKIPAKKLPFYKYVFFHWSVSLHWMQEKPVKMYVHGKVLYQAGTFFNKF
jgi:hypothetical protein